MKTRIRLLEEQDIEACVAICEMNFAGSDYRYDVLHALRSHFAEGSIVKPEYVVFDDNGMIKGVAGFSRTVFDSGVFGLFMCYVHPDFQNEGIGRALTEVRIEMIREKGGLSVLSTTRKMWHLERFGFQPIATPYSDWHIMQLIL